MPAKRDRASEPLTLRDADGDAVYLDALPMADRVELSLTEGGTGITIALGHVEVRRLSRWLARVYPEMN